MGFFGLLEFFSYGEVIVILVLGIGGGLGVDFGFFDLDFY